MYPGEGRHQASTSAAHVGLFETSPATPLHCIWDLMSRCWTAAAVAALNQ